MSSSQRIKKKASKICLGDLDTLVNIYKRDLEAPKDVKYGLNLNLLRENVWVMWETSTNGVDLFDGTNQLIGTATDIVTIHYDADFEEFDFLEFDNNLYQILRTRFLDRKNKEFLVLYCNLKGNKNKKVNIL